MNHAHRLAAVLIAAASLAMPTTLAFADPPVTTPTNVRVDGVSGALTFSADSTAPLVQFSVDGQPGFAPVTVNAGIASMSWESWGYSNGIHSLAAADCADAATCGALTTPITFSVDNSAPVITSPTAGATIRGGFTIITTFTGGGVQLMLDGNPLGTTAATSPYSYNYRGAALTQGSHTIEARACSNDGAHCSGPTKSVTFNADVLHPRIVAISPSPFSPNGDRYRDATTVAYFLPETEFVKVYVYNAHNVRVRSTYLGAVGYGNRAWVWNGRTNAGTLVADGTYTVRLYTTRLINGVNVPGTSGRGVALDTHAPAMSSITGNGATFFPYPDGYHDTFAAGVTLSEGGLLRLTIYRTDGRAVRTISASKAAGRATLAWNGKDAGNHYVTPGSYRWTFMAQDAAGNHRTSMRYAVAVSSKRLVGKTGTVTLNGASHYAIQGNLPDCVQYSDAISWFDHGVWLDNVCDPGYDGFAIIQAVYRFTLPAAVTYGSMTATAYGSTMYSPSEVFVVYFHSTGGFDIRLANVRSTTGAWVNFAGVSGAGHVNSRHQTDLAFGVDNFRNADVGRYASDIDIGVVRLTFRYYVLA